MNRLQAYLLGTLFAFGAAAPALAQKPNIHNTPSVPGATAQVLPDFADLVEKFGPAVVNINTKTRTRPNQGIPGLSEDDPFYEFFKRFMPPDAQGRINPRNAPKGQPGDNDDGKPDAQRGPLRPFGLGSGFIITSDGYIITNAHVVEDAAEITVRLTDKRELKAKVIGADMRSDVAVIKVDATNLPTMKIGDTNKLRVGEWVIAIGSPYGFANTVTAGIVSAKSRENLSGDPNMDAVPFIQTDVAVNPGNSGGPLLNMHGEVVGINSQIFSRTGSFAGISFAIPIDYAYNVAEQIIKTGHVTRGRIGVAITNVTRDLADSLGLAKAQGALVSSVEEGAPAGKAGLEAGDVILKVDGHAIEGSADLSRTIRGVKPGTRVMVNVWRNGKTRDFPVVVAEFKDEQAASANTKGAQKKEFKTGKLGLAVADLTSEQKKALKVTGGVVVEAVEGVATNSGIEPGNVILRVNNTDVANVKAFNDALAKVEPKKPVAFLVRDENGTRYAIIRSDSE